MRNEAEPDIPVTRASVIYLALATLYFLPALLPGAHIYGTDYFSASFFYLDFYTQRLAAGDLPKWIPWTFGGLPIFSNPGGIYHPVMLLTHLLLPTTKLFPVLFVFHFTLAGIGMYLLAVELGCRRWVAFLAGLTFQFTGLMLSFVYAGHDGRITVATTAPLYLFLIHHGVRTGSLRAFAGAAMAMALCLLSFQLQSCVYLLLAGLFWGIFCLYALRTGFSADVRLKLLVRRAALGFASVALAFVMAAVALLPFIAFVPESPRSVEGGRGYEYATGWSMQPLEILGLAVPELVGVDQTYQGPLPFKLHTEYAGALVVLLLMAGVVYARRNLYWRFMAGFALFWLTVALGGSTPLYRLYYAIMPLATRFRAPNLALFVVITAVVIMAALTLEALAAARDAVAGAGERGKRAGRRGAARSDASVSPTWLIPAAAGAITVVGFGFAAMSRPEHVPYAQQDALRFGIFAAATAGLLWAFITQRLGTRWVFIALSVVAVADLWVVGRPFFKTGPPPEQYFAADDVVRFLKAQAPSPLAGRFRVWTLPQPEDAIYRGEVDAYLMYHGIEQASGEHPNVIQRYYEYAGEDTDSYANWHNWGRELNAPADEPMPMISAANIRFIIAGVPLREGTLRLVHEGSALVYENTNVLPRAWLVRDVELVDAADGAVDRMSTSTWDPRVVAYVNDSTGAAAEVAALNGTPLVGGAELMEYTPDRVRIRTRASRPALLVMSDNMYHGWHATSGGAELPVIRTNHTFRGVVVPAGEHEVVFEFRSSALQAGAAVSVASWLAVIAFLLAATVRRRNRTTEGAH